MKDGYRSRANRIGATPFLLAAKGADVEMMRLLVAHGADVTLTTVHHTTPLMMAAGLEMVYPEEDSGTTEDAEKGLALALELGAGEINAANDSLETALHVAAYRESPWMVQTLVDHGARLDAKNQAGSTPLDICVKSRNGPTSATAVLLRKLMLERGLTVEKASTAAEGSIRDAQGRR